jgi:hypothetical protein
VGRCGRRLVGRGLRSPLGLCLAAFEIFPQGRPQPVGFFRGFGSVHGRQVSGPDKLDKALRRTPIRKHCFLALPAACAPSALVARIARLQPAAFRTTPAGMGCRSSVVEHSLGKGEVDSSILSGSTRKAARRRGAIGIREFAIVQLWPAGGRKPRYGEPRGTVVASDGICALALARLSSATMSSSALPPELASPVRSSCRT